MYVSEPISYPKLASNGRFSQNSPAPSNLEMTTGHVTKLQIFSALVLLYHGFPIDTHQTLTYDFIHPLRFVTGKPFPI